MTKFRTCLLAVTLSATGLTACATHETFGTAQTGAILPDHCHAPRDVNWSRTLTTDFQERAVESHANTATDMEWPRTSSLAGDDANIRLFSPTGFPGAQLGFARLERREGVWHMEYRSQNSRPVMRYPPAPSDPALFSCTPAHEQRGGRVPSAASEQLDEWLDAPCREAEPGFIPDLVIHRDGSTDDCLDGSTFVMQVETSAGVTRYLHACKPRFSAGNIMRLIADLEPDENRPSPPPQPFEIEWRGGPSLDEACRQAAESRGIDTSDPWSW
jgi:hypothetical protein